MRTLSVIVMIGLLSALYVAGHLWFQIRGEQTLALELQARINTLEAAIPLPTNPTVPIPTPAPSPVAMSTVAAPIATSRSTAQAEQPVASMIKQVLTPSNSDRLMRMMLLQRYPDVAKELGLPQEQADQLIDVLARQQAETATDTLGVLSGEVTEPGAVQAIESKAEDRRRTAEAEVSTLLGSKYAAWQQYQATAAARLQVMRLQNALDSSNSLSEAQSKSLLAAFAEAQGQLNAERRNEPEMRGSTRQEILSDQINQLETSNQRMFDVASPILTSPQQEIYKRTLDQTNTMMRATLRAVGGGPETRGDR